MSDAATDKAMVSIGDIVNRVSVLEKTARASSDEQAKNNNFREWIKVIITVPSAVAVGIGLIIQLYNFLEYKNKALELNLNQEIISLNVQLNTEDNPGMVRNAIFLLSTLGPDAAPLLIYHINNAGRDVSIIDAIGFGLKQIVEKNRKGNYQESENRIIELLNIRIRDIVNNQLKASAPGAETLADHINVLSTVYSLVGCPNDYRSSINKYFTEVKQRMVKEKEGLSYLEELKKIFDTGIKATEC